MQVVEKRKNNTKVWIQIAFISIMPLFACSQYSLNYSVSDSVKTKILSEYKYLCERSDYSFSKVDRNNMPIFCKWELDIEDNTGLPIKFRIGSFEYVDMLEQKSPLYFYEKFYK